MEIVFLFLFWFASDVNNRHIALNFALRSSKTYHEYPAYMRLTSRQNSDMEKQAMLSL
jgi:hypothetical protein